MLGIDDGNDLISSFEDILILSGIKTIKTQETKKTRKTRKTDEISEVTINVKYEVTDAQSFSEELVNLKTTYSERADQQNKEFSNYRKELQYRQYLALFSSNYFILNFYPKGRDEPAKEFSLASLLKVDTIEANTVKNDNILSQAYNKIVSTYVKNNDMKVINTLVNDINDKVKEMVETNIKNIRQGAVSSI